MQVMNDDVSPTLREQMKHHEPIVCYSVGADLTWQGCSGLTQTATTLDTAARTLSKSQPKTCAIIAVLGGGREHSTICTDGTAPTLCTFQDSKPILIARMDNAKVF